MFQTDLIGTLRAAENGSLLGADIDDFLWNSPFKGKKHASQLRLRRSSRVAVEVAAITSDLQQKTTTMRPAPAAALNASYVRPSRPISDTLFIQPSFERPFDTRIVADRLKQPSKSSSLTKPWRTDEEASISTEDVQKTMRRAVSMLPNDILIKHRMYDIVKERAVRQLVQCLESMLLRVLRINCHRWRARAQHVTYISAVRIQRFLLYTHQIFRLRRHEHPTSEDASTELSLKRAVEYLRWRSAVTLQRRIRGFIARRGYRILRRKLEARRRIESVFVAALLTLRCINAFILQRNLQRLAVRCATLIQKATRGYLARKLFADLSAKTKRRHVDVYSGENEGTSKYFARQGAVLKIQKLYRKYRQRCRLISQVDEDSGSGGKKASLEVLRRLLLVQSIVRRFIAHRRVSALREAHLRRNATTVQRFWRRTLARMHLHSLIHKKLRLMRLRRKAVVVLGKAFRSVLDYRVERESIRLGRILHERKEVPYDISSINELPSTLILFQAGKCQYLLTVQYTKIDFFWRAARQVKNIHNSTELQKLFMNCGRNGR